MYNPTTPMDRLTPRPQGLAPVRSATQPINVSNDTLADRYLGLLLFAGSAITFGLAVMRLTM